MNFSSDYADLRDGEGNFYISKLSSQGRSAYSFNFRISLHIDDSAMLNNIRNNLGFGKVYEYKDKNYSSFTVTPKKRILKS